MFGIASAPSKWNLISVTLGVVMLCLAVNAYAEEVKVTNPENNKGEKFVVGKLEEGGKFYHDRDYTMTGIPKEFLGFTSILTSADSLGGLDYLWTFEIDRPAVVYIAFDSRGSRPEKWKQEPKDWFTKSFSDTGEVLFLDAPHPQTEYWIYKSNEPYPKSKVTLFGIEPSELGNQTLWVIFVGKGELAVTLSKKLATRWGAIKSLR
jgi:hypothetical protein